MIDLRMYGFDFSLIIHLSVKAVRMMSWVPECWVPKSINATTTHTHTPRVCLCLCVCRAFDTVQASSWTLGNLENNDLISAKSGKFSNLVSGNSSTLLDVLHAYFTVSTIRYRWISVPLNPDSIFRCYRCLIFTGPPSHSIIPKYLIHAVPCLSPSTLHSHFRSKISTFPSARSFARALHISRMRSVYILCVCSHILTDGGQSVYCFARV